jgi:hypothetical protein
MVEITYVSIVPKESSARLRKVLAEEDTGPLKWREARSGRGSEFYFTGPPNLVRQTHEYVTLWLANQTVAKRAGKTAEAPSVRPWRTAVARTVAGAAAVLAFSVITFTGSGALG